LRSPTQTRLAAIISKKKIQEEKNLRQRISTQNKRGERITKGGRNRKGDKMTPERDDSKEKQRGDSSRPSVEKSAEERERHKGGGSKFEVAVGTPAG